jgi:hypothetical protein
VYSGKSTLRFLVRAVAIAYVSPPAKIFERYNALARVFVNHRVGAAVYPEDREQERRLREFCAVL